MLVVCNGNRKSGSTWLVTIIESSGIWKPLPDKWRNEKWENPSLHPDKFDAYFREQEWREGDFYCKQHWEQAEKYRYILYDTNIKMLDIIRDIRDALVSQYYHDTRLGFTKSKLIEDYYFRDKGRQKMMQYINYYKFWHGKNGLHPHLTTYEDLSSNFDTEVIRIFDYLGIALSHELLTEIKENSTFKNFEYTGEGRFYRKGIVGDWKNHLNNEVLSDLKELCRSCGFKYLQDNV